MAREIALEINLNKLFVDLKKLSPIIAESARWTIHDIMDDWKRESVHLAPVDTTALRRSISYRTSKRGAGVNVTGEITASAIETSQKWGDFNYAYYIHEVRGDSFKGRAPGTVGRFLDIPAEQHEKEWIKRIEDDIKAKIRATGF